METHYVQKRKFVEIEKELSSKLELLCFLKDVSQKDFVSRAVERGLQPYETWLERAKKLRYGSVQGQPSQYDS